MVSEPSVTNDKVLYFDSFCTCTDFTPGDSLIWTGPRIRTVKFLPGVLSKLVVIVQLSRKGLTMKTE
jgi:hypothetical protein